MMTPSEFNASARELMAAFIGRTDMAWDTSEEVKDNLAEILATGDDNLRMQKLFEYLEDSGQYPISRFFRSVIAILHELDKRTRRG